jgi:hypothetical protein
MVKVEITNTYADRENTEVVEVSEPAGVDEETLEEWWEDEVFPHTGDGYGDSETGYYEAKVLGSVTFPELVGKTCEWDG